MSATDVSWELYRSFLAVARQGSLSGAARVLRLTQPTIGRHIDQLERMLGLPIFTRSPQGLTPTETARALIPIAQEMESAAEAMARTASAQAGETAGVVRITASEVVGVEVLPPILADLADAHPALAFELNLTNRTEDLLRRDADIAVRMVRPTQSGLVARRLGETMLGIYAHRRYLAGVAAPRTIAEVLALRMIGFDRDPLPIAGLGQAGFDVTRHDFSLRTDNQLAQIAALRAGYGVGICQVGIARRDPDLVRLLPDGFALPLETWLVMHEDLRGSPRVRRTFDHLAIGLQAYLATSR